MFKIILVVALCAAVYGAPAAPAQSESAVEEAPIDQALDSSIPSTSDNKEALEGAETAFVSIGYPLIRSYIPWAYPEPIVYGAPLARRVFVF